MALQTNLSKKDKLTIVVLLFAAGIFMIIWFLIRPTVTSIITTNEKIEHAQEKQTEYKNKSMYLSSAEVLYDKTVSDLNASTADYYPLMDSSEIDKMVTSYVLRSGLFSESLTISMNDTPVEETPYIHADPSVQRDSVSSASSSNDKSADSLLTPYNTARSDAKSTNTSDIRRIGLTLVVTGTRSACQALIDDLCTKPAVRISGFSWDKVDMIEVFNEETGLTEYKDSGVVRLRINVYLYMADFSDYSAAVTGTVDNATLDTEE
ncbi:MAG: hypothetical protein K6E12_09955 [Saccharofermentans sp.]|nr:hypothetical protein [Saccharofermentans sp.]